MKKKLSALAFAVSLGASSFSVSAGGLPVVSVTELAQLLVEYQEQLQQGIERVNEFEKTYRTQVQQWEQQVKSATKPYTDAFNNAKQLQATVMQYQDFINNLSYNFQDVQSYLDNKLGSASYWEECAISPSCDPSLALSSQYNNLKGSLTSSISNTQKVQKALDKSMNDITSQFESELQQDPGIEAVATTQARIELQKMKDDNAYHKQMLDYVQQDAEGKMAERKAQQIKELQGEAFGSPMSFKTGESHEFNNLFSDIDKAQ